MKDSNTFSFYLFLLSVCPPKIEYKKKREYPNQNDMRGPLTKERKKMGKKNDEKSRQMPLD